MLAETFTTALALQIFKANGLFDLDRAT
jgi:hypothetical protein